jgi:ABC-2 type transport system ATP-binding protein
VRMLAGLLAPTEGTATVAGHDVRTDPSAVRTRVGLVTDVPGLHEQMTLPAYLDFFARIYGMGHIDRTRRIDELLAFFDLDGHRAERMVGFSKGMKQKVALARALLHEPAALFLDEPTSGLDPLAARAVRELIITLKQANRSIILCTHDLDEAERLADQVAIMRQGRIVARDAPAALRASASPETIVHVDLASPCTAALPALAAVEGVLMPTSVPDGRTPGTIRLEYRTPQPNGVNPRAIAQLVGIGAAIISVTCITRTLEEVYADAMSGEIDAAETRMIETTAVGTIGGGR